MTEAPRRTSSRDPVQRASEVLRAVMSLAAEIALDLEVSSDEARELFAFTLFERAEARHGSARATAAALSTTLRTVQNYRKRRDEPPVPGAFNMRRRVLHLLDEGPADLATIEAKLPVGSDMNYARSALRSLVEDGMVVEDPRIGMYRRANPHYQPWYYRTEEFPGDALALFFEHVSRHVGSRFTPKVEEGTAPASMCALAANVPADRVRDYADEFYRLMAAFEERWRQIDREAPAEEERAFVGCEAAFGRLGPAAAEGRLRELASLARGPIWDTTAWSLPPDEK